MARSDMRLMLAGCMLLASVCMVQAHRGDELRFEIYQHHNQDNELDVFGPRSQDSNDRNNRGRGVVYSDHATRDEDSKSERLADVSGLYFFINNHEVESVSTINFENVDVNDDKRFANAQLHLRGLCNKHHERNTQELTIVGGTKGLSGARGFVRYERVQKGDAYKLIGQVQIDQEFQFY